MPLRDELVARFGALAPVVTASAHDGAFDRAELERVGGGRTPAVFVAQLAAMSPEDRGADVVVTKRWAAFVLAQRGDDVRADSRSPGDLAQLVAERIVAELVLGDPFPAAAGPASKVAARNAFDTTLARLGHALWIVSWEQEEALELAELEAVLDDLETIHTRFAHPARDSELDADGDGDVEDDAGETDTALTTDTTTP